MFSPDSIHMNTIPFYGSCQADFREGYAERTSSDPGTERLHCGDVDNRDRVRKDQLADARKN